ncbi:aldo/keto reductase [Thalassomonas haliotis]|uniref:Aldo/keto reductase n=1 Tax=Thalassomonas haliotis TaxID=485448 RepID=A0ABY7VEY6_9GAMM|nr:aldo/keto reductase [Thalassomonas haliotis]WDE11560.1 aldo/keto reductase [Thalassomonas haliotis]
MKTRKLKNEDISAIGLGCMGMSEFYGDSDDSQSLKVLHEAVNQGITLFDTSDFYGDGHNEKLLGRFLSQTGTKPLISTKTGIVRGADIEGSNLFQRSFNGSNDYIRKSCEASLRRLGVDAVDLYYLHRVDPDTPIEESMESLSQLVKEGKIRHIGLSEANEDEIRRANKVHPLSAVQSEYSLWTRNVETGISALCQELGITFFAYSPLGRGMLKPEIQLSASDFRVNLPRFSAANLQKNGFLFSELTEVSDEYKVSNAQVLLAWLLARGEHIVPIPGTRNVKYLIENCQSTTLSLSPESLQRLSSSFALEMVSGDRYL